VIIGSIKVDTQTTAALCTRQSSLHTKIEAQRVQFLSIETEKRTNELLMRAVAESRVASRGFLKGWIKRNETIWLGESTGRPKHMESSVSKVVQITDQVSCVTVCSDLPKASEQVLIGWPESASLDCINGMQVDPNTGYFLYESDEIIDYLSRTYGDGLHLSGLCRTYGSTVGHRCLSCGDLLPAGPSGAFPALLASL
jgi:hypothetical protein